MRRSVYDSTLLTAQWECHIFQKNVHLNDACNDIDYAMQNFALIFSTEGNEALQMPSRPVYPKKEGHEQQKKW